MGTATPVTSFLALFSYTTFGMASSDIVNPVTSHRRRSSEYISDGTDERTVILPF